MMPAGIKIATNEIMNACWFFRILSLSLSCSVAFPRKTDTERHILFSCRVLSIFRFLNSHFRKEFPFFNAASMKCGMGINWFVTLLHFKLNSLGEIAGGAIVSIIVSDMSVCRVQCASKYVCSVALAWTAHSCMCVWMYAFGQWHRHYIEINKQFSFGQNNSKTF